MTAFVTRYFRHDQPLRRDVQFYALLLLLALDQKLVLEGNARTSGENGKVIYHFIPETMLSVIYLSHCVFIFFLNKKKPSFESYLAEVFGCDVGHRSSSSGA